MSLILEKIRSQFWLLPSVITIILMACLPVLYSLNIPTSSPVTRILLYEGASGEGGQKLLSSIATATMTVIGVLFSITILVLQQVSTQFTPRIIEQFVRSTKSQFVLGFFVGTFGFSLLALRSSGPSSPPEDTIPAFHLAVTMAILLAMSCLALIIFYIHHISKSIESHRILATAREDSLSAMKSLAKQFSEQAEDFELPEGTPTLKAEKSGYIQEIRWKRAEKILPRSFWEVEFLVSSGDFVYEGMPLLRATHQLTDQEIRDLHDIFSIGLQRTVSQDPRFGVKELSDIALRALSPSVNDPSTAIEAIQEIGVLLLFYTKEFRLSSVHQFKSGARIRMSKAEFSSFLSLCYDQIVLAGRDHPRVLQAILQALRVAYDTASDSNCRAALLGKITEVDRILSRLQEENPVMVKAG